MASCDQEDGEGMRHMQAIKRINNNAAVCLDAKGREIIALGRGVGFGELPHEVHLADITRTFYGVDDKYLALIETLPGEELEFAAQFSDVVRGQVSHELSPNLPVTLADHISFAIKRAREHMIVRMPLAFDVQQSYPVEYRLGEMCVNGIQRTFQVKLPPSEAVGVALSIVNSSMSSSDRASKDERRVDRIVDKATTLVEKRFGIRVSRDSFDFARFATHVRYLVARVSQGKPLETENEGLYPLLVEQYPSMAACAEDIARLIADAYGSGLNDEEKAYLVLHVNRVYSRSLDEVPEAAK